MHKIKFLRNIFNQYIRRYKNVLNRYGGFLIFVGAVTPIPFSAICMLVGATGYPFPKFLLMGSARILRFVVYAFVIYQANI
ncbi:MAG: VTT domain-containing protein, partial [Bacteroidota bacterium]